MTRLDGELRSVTGAKHQKLGAVVESNVGYKPERVENLAPASRAWSSTNNIPTFNANPTTTAFPLVAYGQTVPSWIRRPLLDVRGLDPVVYMVVDSSQRECDSGTELKFFGQK